MYPTPKIADRLFAAKLATVNKGIATRQQMLVYIRKHGTADTPALAAHLGMTVSSVRAHLRRLLARGVIEQCDMVWTKPIYRERKPPLPPAEG